MSPYERRRRDSDLFIPHMKAILGTVFFQIAPLEEDLEHNTDLIVFQMPRADRGRIACRVRDAAKYLDRYRDQFTIRATLLSGADTELQKILARWGQVLLYGFGDPATRRLVHWTVADLDVFRLHFPKLWMRPPYGMEACGDYKLNHDGLSWLLAMKWSDFPPEFIIERYWRQSANA